MAWAKRRDQWNHTANLMALLVNINRDPKKGRPARAEEFHPFPPGPIEIDIEEAKVAAKQQMRDMRDGFFGGKVRYTKAQ